MDLPPRKMTLIHEMYYSQFKGTGNCSVLLRWGRAGVWLLLRSPCEPAVQRGVSQTERLDVTGPEPVRLLAQLYPAWSSGWLASVYLRLVSPDTTMQLLLQLAGGRNSVCRAGIWGLAVGTGMSLAFTGACGHCWSKANHPPEGLGKNISCSFPIVETFPIFFKPEKRAVS